MNAISCYLTPGTIEIIDKKSIRISQHVSKMVYGNKATDNGNLILSKEEATRFIEHYPDYAKFVHPYIGSQEFINGFTRYCIFVEECDYSFANSNPELKSRFENIREFRLNSTEKATRDTANRPYSFFFSSYSASESIIVPRVSSERRQYIPIGFLDKEIVIADSANAIYDAQKWLFALLTSKMHNLWVRTVGGRLKTDYRYSATLCYNTFPFPKLTTAEKEELEQLAQNILNIRDENFDMTLGEMYNPETMPDELREAHHQLDLAVERIYRSEPFTSDEERLEHLFKLYAKMTKK